MSRPLITPPPVEPAPSGGAIIHLPSAGGPLVCRGSAGGSLIRTTRRRVTRGLALSAGVLFTVSVLGAAKVHTASREVRPAAPAPAAKPPPAVAAKPVSIQLRVLSPVTSEVAKGETPEVPLAVLPQPAVQLAAYRTAPATGEMLRDAMSTPAALASASADARAPRRVATLRMEVTAYCPCTRCCGPLAQGITASGLLVSHDSGRFVAADTGILRFGTRLEIPGYHDARPVEVIDRGGAIKGYKLDVYFPSHEEALLWGRKMLDVNVVE